MKSSALMVNVSKITDCDYESIIQSLITNVDEIWINALALDINSSSIVNKLLSLKEAGLMNFWDYELNLNERNILNLDRVITYEEYKESNIYIQEILDDITNNTMKKQSDFTTYNIENKNMLSNFMIAKYCNNNSIIQRNTPCTSVSTGEADLLQAYAKYLFNYTNISAVSGLTIEEILTLRKYSKYFRNRIKTYIEKNIVNGNIPISTIKKDCEEISKEYCEEINNRIKHSLTLRGIGKGIALDIASIWIIPVTLYSISQKLWDAVFNREQRGFIMYLTTLKNSQKIN